MIGKISPGLAEATVVARLEKVAGIKAFVIINYFGIKKI